MANLLANRAQRSGKRQYHVAHAVVHPAHSAVARVIPRGSSADATRETAAAACTTADCAVGRTADKASCPHCHSMTMQLPQAANVYTQMRRCICKCMNPGDAESELTGLEQSICFLHLYVQL